MDLKNAMMEHFNDLITHQDTNQDIHGPNEIMGFLLSPPSSNANSIQGSPECFAFPGCGSTLALLTSGSGII